MQTADSRQQTCQSVSNLQQFTIGQQRATFLASESAKKKLSLICSLTNSLLNALSDSMNVFQFDQFPFLFIVILNNSARYKYIIVLGLIHSSREKRNENSRGNDLRAETLEM